MTEFYKGFRIKGKVDDGDSTDVYDDTEKS